MLAEGERRSSGTPSGVVADIETFIAALQRDEYADDPWSDEPPGACSWSSSGHSAFKREINAVSPRRISSR